MTGQDWGSEGLASDQAGAKGPLHIMAPAKRLECCGACVCVHSYCSNLQQATAGDPGRAGGLVKTATFEVGVRFCGVKRF